MPIKNNGDESFKVAAVVPAFNEHIAIGSVVLKAKQAVDTVIVVDDGSTDETAAIAAMAGATVLRLSKNQGKGFALAQGLDYVKADGFKAAVVLDGDGQHNAEEISRIVEPIKHGEADLVIGSRFLNNGHNIPAYRVIGQKILNKCVNISAGGNITDTQSGFRAVSRKGLEQLNFKSEGYSIESDMIVNFAEKGLKIKEVPINVEYDVPNGHKKGALSMGAGLFNQVTATIAYKRPLMFFGIPGMIFVFIGLILGLFSLMNMYLVGSWLFQALSSAFFLMLGSVMLMSGLTLNSLTKLMSMKGM